VPGNQLEQLDLFDREFPLRWLPDETLYSLAARYHRLVGSPISDVVAQRLFGATRRDQHDLPGGIDHFVHATSGLLGDAESIIREHTILPLYLPLRPAAQAEEAIQCMRGWWRESLKYRMGILASRCGARHPLKLCSQCLARLRLRPTSHGVSSGVGRPRLSDGRLNFRW
jgi:hypothetical protein